MMKKKNPKKISQALFVCFLVILWIPALQMIFQIIDEKPLLGAIEKVEEPAFTPQEWLDGTYQQKADKYLNQSFGFRNVLVRIYNQINFFLYNKTTAKGVVIGEENYLYELNYIKSYYGQNFIGDSLIAERVHRLQIIRDTLLGRGKQLIVAIAPGKGYFYPDKIPKEMRSERSSTNYASFLRQASAADIDLIDFNAWFLDMKDEVLYPIYPKTGIHWSEYGLDLALDSLFSYIEITNGIDIPDYIVGEPSPSTTYIAPDTDLEDGMNLLFPISNIPMAYSDHEVLAEGKKKPKVMVISDSFFWSPYNRGIMYSVFDNGEFWYYNREIFSPAIDDFERTSEVSIWSKIMDKDIVILMCTETNLKGFPWGFDESAVDVFLNYDENFLVKREEDINTIVSTIYNSEDWLEKVKQKAIDKNIPLDEMVRKDATYIYEMKKKKKK